MSRHTAKQHDTRAGERLSRQAFLRLGLGTLGALVGVSLLTSGCGGSEEASPDAGTPDAGDAPDAGEESPDAGEGGPDAGEDGPDAGDGTCEPAATIGSNHGHSLVVPAADVEAGVERSYDIQGASGHPHTVTLSAADFGLLAQGEQVVLTSSTGAGHTHPVTIVCGA